MTYSKRQLMDMFDISLLTVRETLKAIGLPTRAKLISEQQARYFALARWLLEVEGRKLSEIEEMFDAGVELDSNCSFLGIAAELARAKQGFTVSDLALEYGLGETTVRRTLQKLGLGRRRYFDSDDISRFAQARQLHSTDTDSTDSVEASPQGCRERENPAWTKTCLCQRYGLSLLTVRRTLDAAGLSTRQQRYSELEVKRFALARDLISQGYTYSQVTQKLQTYTSTSADRVERRR